LLISLKCVKHLPQQTERFGEMKAFISYAHRDHGVLERLHTHLAVLRREGTIVDWHDRNILAGAVIDLNVDAQLESSQLMLALVSPDFLSSQYCYEKEMKRAMELHAAGRLVIIPVIVEPCDWLSSPLKQFKALPRDGKPISEWTNQNTALLDVVGELRRLVSVPASMPPSGEGLLSQHSQPSPAGKYRMKRTFDRIDNDEFRSSTYEVIRKYFEDSSRELNGIEGLRARYQTIGPTSFTCTVVNRLIKSGRGGEAHITVHASPRMMLGDIYYSFAPFAPDNTAQGSFSIDSDDYHLFLRRGFSSGADERRSWSPLEAAARLWGEFLQQAGITYD
jgi:TIR domain